MTAFPEQRPNLGATGHYSQRDTLTLPRALQ